MGDKRKGSGDAGGGKRAKRRYFNDTFRAQNIPRGTRGVLISCLTGKENLAAREGIAVLSEAYENLCPREGTVVDGDEAAQSETLEPAHAIEDISAILSKEVDELKDAKKQPFYYHTLGIPSLVYVEARYKSGPTPTELVAHACQAAKESKQNKTRLCSRFYPIERVCGSTMAEMEALAKEIADAHFPKDGKPVTFAVEFDKRAAPSGIDRMAVVDAFARAVPQPPYKVNLSNSEKTIMVNIAKGSCGVAVVDNFKGLGKFNLRLLATGGEGDEG